VENKDLVFLPGQLDVETYMVLGIAPTKGRRGTSLKGCTKIKVDTDEPINCRAGSW